MKVVRSLKLPFEAVIALFFDASANLHAHRTQYHAKQQASSFHHSLNDPMINGPPPEKNENCEILRPFQFPKIMAHHFREWHLSTTPLRL